jgi:hypothetical protein
MAKKGGSITTYQSSVTGQYVSQQYAASHPKTTFSHTRPKGK